MLLESMEEKLDSNAEQPTPPSPIFHENYLILPLFSLPKSKIFNYKLVDLNASKATDFMQHEHDKISANEQETSEDTPKTQWQELSIYSSSPLTKKELESPCQFHSSKSEAGTPWGLTPRLSK